MFDLKEIHALILQCQARISEADQSKFCPIEFAFLSRPSLTCLGERP